MYVLEPFHKTSLRHYLQTQSQGNHTINHLEERGSWQSWKDKKGPSSVRQTLELFQRQCWGILREMGWNIHGLFRAHQYHLELNCSFNVLECAGSDCDFFNYFFKSESESIQILITPILYSVQPCTLSEKHFTLSNVSDLAISLNVSPCLNMVCLKIDTPNKKDNTTKMW